MTETYVMPEPEVRLVGGKFSFTGNAIPVTPQERALDYLRKTGVYDSQADVWNGSVYFSDKFSVKDSQEMADEALAIMDGQRLIKDLEEKGYAFVMAKGAPGDFKDYKDKGFVANWNRVAQELGYQKWLEEESPGFGIRHFKTQEAVEKMGSDEEFRKIMTPYWAHGLEAIQKMDTQKVSGYQLVEGVLDIADAAEILTPIEATSFRFYWGGVGARANVDANRPLYRIADGVAAWKKVPLQE